MHQVTSQLADTLSASWQLLLLRGLAAIGLGIVAWLQPGLSLATLILFFGAYALVDGVLGIVTALAGRKEKESWWVLLLWALVSVIVGAMTLTTPAVTGLILLFYIAIWAIAAGVVQIIAAVRLRKDIAGEWFFILAGLASLAFGVLLIARPAAGALSLLWLIAGFTLVYGVLLVLLALRVRAFARRLRLA